MHAQILFSITKHKPKMTQRAEATLTFHLPGHRLVGLQPVLRPVERTNIITAVEK